MDGRGRLAQSLTGPGPVANPGDRRRPPRRATTSRALALLRVQSASRFERFIARYARVLEGCKLTRGGGVAASILIILSAIAYGVIKGGHTDVVAGAFHDLRDVAGTAAGFRVTGVALSGNKHLNREEVLARAGVTGNTALLFFDVADARDRLLADPWVADATIQKLYPDRLQITLTEREAFALWQKNGRISVIGADGTVLEPFLSRPYAPLPLVVGRGAETRAKAFLALLARYPEVRDNLRAAILIAERRWNLRLKNGIDVRLPEADVERALADLVALDRDKKLLSRDIAAIDLRLPDRVTVRLSEAAAQAREAEIKERAKARKGGAV
jgi:cell division protein FtsQ